MCPDVHTIKLFWWMHWTVICYQSRRFMPIRPGRWFPLVHQAENKQGSALPFGDTHVSFQSTVALLNKMKKKTGTKILVIPPRGDDQKNLGTINATAKVARGLRNRIRFLLEHKKVPHKDIENVLRTLGPLKCYDTGFRKLFVILQKKRLEPLQVSGQEFSSAFLDLHKLSQADSRCVCASLQCLPGLESIRFHPVLTKIKMERNPPVQRYAAYWDPIPTLKKSTKVFWHAHFSCGVSIARDR